MPDPFQFRKAIIHYFLGMSAADIAFQFYNTFFDLNVKIMSIHFAIRK